MSSAPFIVNETSYLGDTPYGLKLQQTITSSGAVTVPSHIKRVYAVCIGGGGGGGTTISQNVRNITAISGDGTTVTYTCGNNFVAGMSVTTTGSSIAGYNVTTATIASASSTNFTVTNATTGTPTLTAATATAATITTGAAAGGTITAVTASSPAAGQVTYSTTTAVPVGVPVTIAGATPSGYNGTFVVVASNPGTSFTVNNTTTGAATGTITFTGVVRYTAKNNYNVGSIVDISGHTPTGFNGNGQTVVRADSNEFSIASTLAQSTTWTSGGASQFYGHTVSSSGGGGAGGFSAGWTLVPGTCTVGTGGAGGQMGLAFETNSTTFSLNNPNGHGKNGNDTIFGQVIGGGGSSGAGTSFTDAPTTRFASVGAGGGGDSQWTGATTSGASYTGAPSASSNSVGYGGGGGGNTVGAAGVSGGGGGRNGGAITNSSLTGNAGGRGLIGGGGGSVMCLNTATGGAGGAGDRFAGGSGSTGTGYGFGAGGGGGGYIAAGSNASGNNGGNGGDGGGGGGAGCNNGTGGNGGNGVIYIYY